MKDLRSLPSVDQLINGDRLRNEIVEYGRPLTINAVRTVLENARQQYKNGIPLPDQAEIIHQIGLLLCEWTRPTLIPVINATLVICSPYKDIRLTEQRICPSVWLHL